jgi:hypothetical protein
MMPPHLWQTAILSCLFLAIVAIAVDALQFRFAHPELTETQLYAYTWRHSIAVTLLLIGALLINWRRR